MGWVDKPCWLMENLELFYAWIEPLWLCWRFFRIYRSQDWDAKCKDFRFYPSYFIFFTDLDSELATELSGRAFHLRGFSWRFSLSLGRYFPPHTTSRSSFASKSVFNSPQSTLSRFRLIIQVHSQLLLSLRRIFLFTHVFFSPLRMSFQKKWRKFFRFIWKVENKYDARRFR